MTHTSPALLPQEALEAVTRETPRALGLPNRAYVDEAFLRFERERLFARTWNCIGVASDLPESGCAMPIDCLGLPLLALRDKEGGIRVFHNVCSHRGQQLVSQPCRVRGVLRCPYHAWTYGLDGRLRGTPHIGGAGVHELPGFERSRHGLRPVRSAVWLDMIFVNLSGDAPPFETHIAPLAERWRGFWGDDGPGLLGRVEGDEALTFEVRGNWKLAVENYCESYHLPWVHPSLNRYSRLEDHYHIFGGGLFCGQGSTAYNLADVAGLTLPQFPGWPPVWLRTAEYISLYPNALLGIHADHFFSLVVEPLAPDLTREHLRIYYAGDGASSDVYESARVTLVDSWRAVFAEDVPVVEGLQRGRRSPAFEGGIFTPVMDTPTHHFHRWVANRLASRAPGDAAPGNAVPEHCAASY